MIITMVLGSNITGRLKQTKCSGFSTTGDESHSATTGNFSHSATTGYQSIAVALGIESTAAAAIGEWIVLADWRKDKNDKYSLHGGKWIQVDGKKIKPNVFYTLVNGEPVEATVD